MSRVREAAAASRAAGSCLPGVEAALLRAEADELNAVLRLYPESALAQAERVDAALASGEDRPLAGVPVLIKDNLCYRDHPTTAGSRSLEGFRPPYTATAIERLLAAGAVVIGATNMDEFAMGSSTETSCYGPTANPADHSRIPGGSSGGSAAAVGAGIVPLSLGSDTGGSIRQPAAHCGCVGFKPSYGRVSRYGLIAFGSSLDQIGPLTTDVAGAAACLRAIAGHDPRDATSVPTAGDDLSRLANLEPVTAHLSGRRIGYVAAHAENLQPTVAAALDRAKEVAVTAGAELVPVELPHERYAVSVYYVLATGEAASNLSRYDGIHYGHRAAGAGDLYEVYARSRGEGFGQEVKRRVILGTYVLSAGYVDAYYKQAQKVRRLLADDYATAFAACDCLLGPTCPGTAFPLGDKLDDPLQMYLQDVFTIGANLAGLPGLSLPAGHDENGLPIGVQLLAPRFGDVDLLRYAAGLEAALDGALTRAP